jgi:hypothetical protein
MTHTDPTRHHAQLLLTREATLAEHYARRYCAALDNGDPNAARRWNREYRLSALRCRALGVLLRTPATADVREAHRACTDIPALDCPSAGSGLRDRQGFDHHHDLLAAT